MSGLIGIPPKPISGGIPGPFKAGGNEREAGDGRIVGAFDVGGMDWLLASTQGWGDCVFTGGTERDEIELTADVVVGVFAALDPTDVGATGGVDDPKRDGIEIDESDDVEETGDGTAVTLVDTPLLDVVFVLDVGASKFEIVGECFLLLADPPLAPGDWTAGDETIDCLELGDDTDVDVLVHVVGTLLALAEAAEADLPFGIDVAVLGCWPLFCTEPTWFGNDVKCVLSVSFATCKNERKKTI